MAALKGKIVLITGASRGIGAATARHFAQAGARLGLVARSAGPLEALAAEVGATALPGDVADPAVLADAVARMMADHGRLDVLINNAGVIEPIARMHEVDAEAWGRAIDITLKGAFNGFRAALPVMRGQGGGTILTIGSGAAYNALEGWSAYCTAKAGAMMLTRVADQESRGAGIRAISLSPGTVATDMQSAIRDSGINPVSRLDWSSHIPPEWPARALAWMCTPAADPWLGKEISLRDDEIRRRVGLIA